LNFVEINTQAPLLYARVFTYAQVAFVFVFLRQGVPRLAWNSLCTSDWPWTGKPNSLDS
jgi:hypothetical protein